MSIYSNIQCSSFFVIIIIIVSLILICNRHFALIRFHVIHQVFKLLLIVYLQFCVINISEIVYFSPINVQVSQFF